MLIFGHFNTKVGSSNKGHESAMGKHGIGERNENGDRLLDVCEINNLVITCTIFPHKPRQKITWILLMEESKTKLTMCLLKQHRISILVTRTMKGADVSSNHKLVRSKIRIKLKKQNRNKDKCKKKYNFTKLQQPEKRKAFTLELKIIFQLLDEIERIEDIWKTISKGYNETADIVRVKEKGHKP